MELEIKGTNHAKIADETRELEASLAIAQRLKLEMAKFGEAKNLEDVQSYLVGMTQSRNLNMASDMMNLKDEYKFIIDNVNNIDFNNYTSSVKNIKNTAIDAIVEKYTYYYTKEEQKYVNAHRAVVKKINEIDFDITLLHKQHRATGYFLNESVLMARFNQKR
jgi:hypothetical protein